TAVAAAGERVLALVPAEVGQQAAAGRRHVAALAHRHVGGELEVGVGGRQPGPRKERGAERAAGVHGLAPSSIHRRISAMSGGGSGTSGGMRSRSRPSRRYRMELFGSPGVTYGALSHLSRV